jgi:hypothetical protein
LEAVELSIATPWNNGSIEGHINRLKAIKRQTYGRAGFELLKARVMPWHVTQAAVLGCNPDVDVSHRESTETTRLTFSCLTFAPKVRKSH